MPNGEESCPPVVAPVKGPKGFLQSDPGRLSYMRVMSMISFVVSIFFAYMELSVVKAGNVPYLTIMYLTAAFAPKTVQAFAEQLKK